MYLFEVLYKNLHNSSSSMLATRQSAGFQTNTSVDAIQLDFNPGSSASNSTRLPYNHDVRESRLPIAYPI